MLNYIFDIIFEIIPTLGKLKAEIFEYVGRNLPRYLYVFEELYYVYFQHIFMNFICRLVHL